jgi:hypothetical protein
LFHLARKAKDKYPTHPFISSSACDCCHWQADCLQLHRPKGGNLEGTPSKIYKIPKGGKDFDRKILMLDKFLKRDKFLLRDNSAERSAEYKEAKNSLNL